MTLRRAALAEILALRHAVLRPGLPPDSAAFDDDTAPATRHFGAFDDAGTIVGCLSWMLRPLDERPAYQLRGMAVALACARRGVGTALLRFAEDALLAETGPLALWCNARTGAIPFYARLGWTVVSDRFDIPGVGPHVRMRRA